MKFALTLLATLLLWNPTITRATPLDCSDFDSEGTDQKVALVYNSLDAVINAAGGDLWGGDCFYLGKLSPDVENLKNKKLWLTPNFDLGQFRQNFEYKLSSYCFPQEFSPLKEMYRDAGKLNQLGRDLSRFLGNEMNLPPGHPCWQKLK